MYKKYPLILYREVNNYYSGISYHKCQARETPTQYIVGIPRDNGNPLEIKYYKKNNKEVGSNASILITRKAYLEGKLSIATEILQKITDKKEYYQEREKAQIKVITAIQEALTALPKE